MASFAYLTKRVAFGSLHELKNPKLSDSENKIIFGKCFRQHGHNYFLEVTVKGKIDERSGLICDRDVFDGILEREIVKFNGQDLNMHFKSTTGEELARAFFNLLQKSFKEFLLVGVRLQETPKNFFAYGPLYENPTCL